MISKHKNNNLFVICSGTKGVGKTWFCSALAQSLGMIKQKVLLFDADLSAENIAFQLNLEKSDLYAKMLQNKITLNNAVKTYTKGHFDVIYAEPLKNGLSTYPVGRCQILALDLKAFCLNYDAVLVDCSDRNQMLKNVFLKLANHIILMIEPNLNGNVDAYKELERIVKISPNADIWIVVNHALSYSEGEQIFKTLIDADNRFIGSAPKLLGVIRQDGRIRDCIANKTTLFERYPVSESLRDISNFAKTLISGAE
ncbi:MAG: AAA family ATPase [Alphaproteobacteria bacterium]|nr:AAA family ATPase [Alphaproteobacteria bacterium]